MKIKKIAALLLTLTLCACAMVGCSEELAQVIYEPAVTLENFGEETSLVMGALDLGDERTALLREIADKYTSDFNNTQIELRTYATTDELCDALANGELDIAEITSDTQSACVRDALLYDFYPHLAEWEGTATLSQAAQFAMFSMGSGHAYIFPNEISQNVLYYRSDWFEAYNEGRDDGTISFRTWDQIGGRTVDGNWVVGSAQSLGENGGLALAGKDELLNIFDSMIFSSITLGRVSDAPVAYFSAVEGHKTVFTLDKTAEAVDQFQRVIENAVVPESLDWTQDEAVAAFCEGRASMLLADRTAYDTIAAALPEGSFTVEAYPRGLTGTAVFTPKYFSGWAVASTCEAAETATHFLAFLSNADNNTYYSKITGSQPIHTEAVTLEESLEETNLAAELAMVDRPDWYRFGSAPTMYTAYAEFRSIADEQLREFINGTLSKEELLADFDEYWSATLDSEGALWQ